MKIANVASTVDTNNNSQTSYDFNIGDVSTIIDILRNRLYSNPIQTLTQEYLSNARDSHREAGKADVPVRVTLPTKLDSSLKIRDFGVGLSKDRVRDVFVSYGISTKRKDNVQTGGFGLGAKSAWAYTDSFVIVSYYNGVCSTYVAHTGKNSNGTFELMNECETSEPNGVEVQIPVKETDINKFVAAVYRTTIFWDCKPELLGITDIETPTEYLDPLVRYSGGNVKIVLDNSFNSNIFETGHYNQKAFLLIDKIPYNISKFVYQIHSLNQLLNIIKKENILFIEVENGSVDVAASREEIASDSKNLEKIGNVCKSAIETVSGIVKKQFDKNFENVQQYLEVYSEVKDTFNCNNVPKEHLKLQYNYEDINFELRGLVDNFFCNKFVEIFDCHVEEQENRSVLRYAKTDLIRVNSDIRIVIQDAEFSNILIKRKAKKLLEDNVEHVYFVKCDPKYYKKLEVCCKALFISNLKHDALGYKATKRLEGMVSFRPIVVDRNSRSIKVVSLGKKEISLEQMSREGKYAIIPFGNNEKYDFDSSSFINMVGHLNKNNFTVIKCSKKDFDQISELENVHDFDDVKKNVENYLPIPNQQIENTVIAGINRNLHGLKRFAKEIECPKLQKLLGLYPENLVGARINCNEHILNMYSHYSVAMKKFEDIQGLEKEIFEMYPLLHGHHYHYENMNKEYIYYINNKHQTVFSKNKN